MLNKIIVIGSDYKWEEEQLTAHEGVDFWLLSDIEVQMGRVTRFVKEGKDLLENIDPSTHFIIRRSRGNYEKLVSLVEVLQKRDFKMTDSFRSVVTNLNKEIFLTTVESSIFPHPPQSFFIENKKSIEYKRSELEFPIISKPVLGRHGEGILIHDDFDGLQKAIHKSDENLLVQRYIELDSEYRIFVVGNKALGAVMKKAAPGKKIANYAAGAEFISIQLDQHLLAEAIRLCKVQEIDIGGVDIVKDRSGNWYLLEINRCPEFKAFSSATNVKVDEEIIHFARSL